MRVASISNSVYSGINSVKAGSAFNTTGQNPAFRAKLVVANDAARYIRGEKANRFSRVMSAVEDKLLHDPIKKKDVVKISAPYDAQTISTKYGDELGNLRVSIKDTYADMFYNVKSSESELAEAVYNTYQHVRYLRHFKVYDTEWEPDMDLRQFWAEYDSMTL